MPYAVPLQRGALIASGKLLSGRRVVVGMTVALKAIVSADIVGIWNIAMMESVKKFTPNGYKKKRRTKQNEHRLD
jgi:hypothetical protein